MVSSDGRGTWAHKGIGLVSEIFTEEDIESLKGNAALGHVLDTASSGTSMAEIQPFTASHRGRTMSVAHNGSILNLQTLRKDLQDSGTIFHSDIDSEVVIHLLAGCRDMDLESTLQETFSKIKGAFAMALMINDILIAVRDPYGFRPLCLGRLDNGGYIVASETCALDLVGARYLRDIEPGEILVIRPEGLSSVYLAGKSPCFCIFEQIYFSRPDSDVFGVNVYQSRKRMGEMLARECRVDGDCVLPFPDSGTYAALGYAQATGIPFEMGLIRNHYIGRTFIQSARTDRNLAVRMKINQVRSLLRGKRVIIVDDSAISGATVASKVYTLREAGVREMHLLVSCPPIRFTCPYGVHFPSEENLLAHGKSVDDIREKFSLDTMHYLSLEGLLEAAGCGADSYCKTCMDGIYPLGNH